LERLIRTPSIDTIRSRDDRQASGPADARYPIYNLLHRHRWRKLMPRPFHPKRDVAAQNAFKKAAFLML
jgi:hypothetical protein